MYNGLEPHVKRGEIKQIAVVQEVEKSTHSPFTNKRPDGPGMRAVPVFGFQFPLVSCGATYAPKKVWGMADVGEDGSAAFRVPSEVPIYFLALDGEGRAVQRMRTFTHLMPGEVQGCVGCHADRNSVVPARPRQQRTTHVTPSGTSPTGVGRQGIQLSRRSSRACSTGTASQCHNEREQAGNVDLTGDMTDFFNVSYDVLCRTGTQGEKNWMLHGSPSGAEYDKVRGMSPYVEWIWTINGSRDEHPGDRAPALGQSGEQAGRDHPQRAPGQGRQAAGQRARRRSPPRVSVDGPEHSVLRHVVVEPQGRSSAAGG